MAASARIAHAAATVMFVAVDAQCAGLVGVADPIKATTREAISALHDEGIKVVMLTGDNARQPKRSEAARHRQIVAEVLPRQKRRGAAPASARGPCRGDGGRRHERCPYQLDDERGRVFGLAVQHQPGSSRLLDRAGNVVPPRQPRILKKNRRDEEGRGHIELAQDWYRRFEVISITVIERDERRRLRPRAQTSLDPARRHPRAER